jgi:hypothetical protein
LVSVWCAPSSASECRVGRPGTKGVKPVVEGLLERRSVYYAKIRLTGPGRTGELSPRYDFVLGQFMQYSILPMTVSDHYPVWAEFATANDTDQIY